MFSPRGPTTAIQYCKLVYSTQPNHNWRDCWGASGLARFVHVSESDSTISQCILFLAACRLAAAVRLILGVLVVGVSFILHVDLDTLSHSSSFFSYTAVIKRHPYIFLGIKTHISLYLNPISVDLVTLLQENTRFLKVCYIWRSWPMTYQGNIALKFPRLVAPIRCIGGT